MHWELADDLGVFLPQFRDQLQATRILHAAPEKVRHAAELRDMGNWCKHAPPPAATAMPAMPAGISALSLEDFRAKLYSAQDTVSNHTATRQFTTDAAAASAGCCATHCKSSELLEVSARKLRGDFAPNTTMQNTTCSSGGYTVTGLDGTLDMGMPLQAPTSRHDCQHADAPGLWVAYWQHHAAEEQDPETMWDRASSLQRVLAAWHRVSRVSRLDAIIDAAHEDAVDCSIQLLNLARLQVALAAWQHLVVGSCRHCNGTGWKSRFTSCTFCLSFATSCGLKGA